MERQRPRLKKGARKEKCQKKNFEGEDNYCGKYGLQATKRFAQVGTTGAVDASSVMIRGPSYNDDEDTECEQKCAICRML